MDDEPGEAAAEVQEEAAPPTRQMEGGLQADAAEETRQVRGPPSMPLSQKLSIYLSQKRRARSLRDSRPHALERHPSVVQLHRRQIVAHALDAPSWFEQESRANAESSV
eukprot:scaffold109800_cov75-Phaeocystis_antarctica.AAC.2